MTNRLKISIASCEDQLSPQKRSTSCPGVRHLSPSVKEKWKVSPFPRHWERYCLAGYPQILTLDQQVSHREGDQTVITILLYSTVHEVPVCKTGQETGQHNSSLELQCTKRRLVANSSICHLIHLINRQQITLTSTAKYHLRYTLCKGKSPFKSSVRQKPDHTQICIHLCNNYIMMY